MKKLEGKEVFLLPTGNNARGCKQGTIERAVIVKVARVFVTFRHKSGFEEKYRISENDKMHLRNNHNGGYKVFSSLQAVEDHNTVNKLSEAICEKYPYRAQWARLDSDTIKIVALLLGVNV